MFFTHKLIILSVVFLGAIFMSSGSGLKRDLVNSPPRLEFLQLGNFGPISRLPTHPAFAHLGLTPHQSVGFMGVLLENGFLNPNALRSVNGHPFVPTPQPFFFGAPSIDPYFLFILSNYARYLPYGLGPQGIYGSTGLPKVKPLGVLKYNDKN